MNEIRQRNPLRPPISFPSGDNFLDVDERVLPYLPVPNETRQQKVKRSQRIRELFKSDLDAKIGVKSEKLLNAFSRGRGEEK
jgi:hypothetical protein